METLMELDREIDGRKKANSVWQMTMVFEDLEFTISWQI